MSVAVGIAAALVVLTKALDCATTLRAIVARGAVETNPIGRWLMQRLGVAVAVGSVFAVSAAISAAFAWVALVSGSTLVQCSYVVLACFVAFVQAVVAHTNWSGRWNAVTTRVLAWHGGVRGVFLGSP
jgi:hypothetical protein